MKCITDSEPKKYIRFEETDYIQKLLDYAKTRASRNAIAEMISSYYCTAIGNMDVLIKCLLSHLHKVEFNCMASIFKVLSLLISRIEKADVYKAIASSLFTEIEFHFSYITSFYQIMHYLFKILKKNTAFAKEFCTVERISKIQKQLDELSDRSYNINYKSYELLKVRKGTTEQLISFIEQAKSFESFDLQSLQLHTNKAQFLSTPDSDEEITCSKGGEYDIVEQGSWVRAKLVNEEENFYIFEHQSSGKTSTVWICKDSDDYYAVDKRVKNNLYRALYKLGKY